MQWEKKVPDHEGLWANSRSGKTIDYIHLFRKDVIYDYRDYWCRIGDIPEISPKMKKLSIEDLMKCLQTSKSIYVLNKDTNKFSSERTIESIKLFNDGSYIVDVGYKVTDISGDFYADL